MKLRNKKTGEIVNKIDVSQDNEGIWVYGNKLNYYRTLAGINKDWEDYKEPLFTKKAAQMCRLWAEIQELRVVKCSYICDGIVGIIGMTGSSGEYVSIDIPETNVSEKITVGTEYTIDELCGNE